MKKLIDTWWHNHHTLGGSVYSVDHPILDAEKAISKLKQQLSNVSVEYIMKFMEAEVTNNSVPMREPLEDISKIYWLTQEIVSSGLMFPPILLHEPWKDRWRIHPGSGRAIAVWLLGWKTIPCIYYYFNESRFKIPPNATLINNTIELNDSIKLQHQSPFYECYSAFDRGYATKDAEWAPDITTHKDWQFLWYSEGPKFLNYKQEWRKYALDAYEMINTL